jgi:hypothetical protein
MNSLNIGMAEYIFIDTFFKEARPPYPNAGFLLVQTKKAELFGISSVFLLYY